MKDSIKLVFAVFVLGFVGVLYPVLEAFSISLNGVVCNYSADSIWVTVTEAGMMQAAMMHRGGCTNPLTQDVEAVWGKDCSDGACRYQAWKLGAGIFEVDNIGSSPGATLHIRGMGAGSQWHINWDWPRPDLLDIHYSLTR